MLFNKITKYRFSLWIAVFLFLLIGIPFSIIVFEAFIIAKLFGFLLVLSLLVAISFWFAVSRNRNDVVSRVILNKNDLFDLHRDFKGFSKLSTSVQDLVVNRIGILMSKVKLLNQNNELLERRQAIQISYMFICENWTDDFHVDSNWIFVFLDADSLTIDKGYRYQLLASVFSQKRINMVPPKSH